MSGLDATAVARCLSQMADHEDDLADAYFERLEEVEYPAADEEPGIRVRREEGFAIRLVRGGHTWLAARDQIAATEFGEALRQVARAQPSAPYPEPTLDRAPFPPLEDTSRLARFPTLVTRAIRRQLAAFPMRLRVRWHRRWIRVIGTQLAPEPQSESFYSCDADLPWGRFGVLTPDLSAATVERLATSLTTLFRAQEAPRVEPTTCRVVLGPHAAAVLLHEVVAHALETDTLMMGGRVESALGLQLGGPLLNVLDDPTNAPESVRRSSDDEGMIAARRWLLREGVVEQPLADLFSARHSKALMPGAARRGNRHRSPAPRSTHLELLPGESSMDDLFAEADGGLYFPEVSSGRLDPLSGRFTISLPYGKRIKAGSLGELLGPCRLRGTVSGLLSGIDAVGRDLESAGAGWCAKNGLKLPVWASSPAVRIGAAEVES
ncbi:MAG: metallopeptidase TldD-related protein [Thermoanaerobaculia bacterium]